MISDILKVIQEVWAVLMFVVKAKETFGKQLRTFFETPGKDVVYACQNVRKD